MPMTRFLRLVRGSKYDGREMSALSFLSYDESVQLASQIVIPTESAALCSSDHIFDHRMNRRCPKCGSTAWVMLVDIGVHPVKESDFPLIPVIAPKPVEA